jgi:hypothetical protein
VKLLIAADATSFLDKKEAKIETKGDASGRKAVHPGPPPLSFEPVLFLKIKSILKSL